MINLLITLVSSLKSLTYFSLLLSYKVGEGIIIILKCISTLLKVGATKGLYVLKVLVEDFGTFWTDILHHIVNILLFLNSGVNAVFTLCILVFEAVKATIYSLFNGVLQMYNIFNGGIEAMIASVIQIFVFAKRLLLLIGAGVWFAITFIPLSIISLSILLTHYLTQLLDEVRTMIYELFSTFLQTLWNIYTFITDVPFESAIGLLAGLCIAYVLINFHVTVYQFISEKIQSFLTFVLRHIQAIQVRIKRGGSDTEYDSEETSEGEEDTSEDRYCVVCQDRYKCVLILPCKHLCVCNECNTRLRSTRSPCPICRCEVRKTMKVFV